MRTRGKLHVEEGEENFEVIFWDPIYKQPQFVSNPWAKYRVAYKWKGLCHLEECRIAEGIVFIYIWLLEN